MCQALQVLGVCLNPVGTGHPATNSGLFSAGIKKLISSQHMLWGISLSSHWAPNKLLTGCMEGFCFLFKKKKKCEVCVLGVGWLHLLQIKCIFVVVSFWTFDKVSRLALRRRTLHLEQNCTGGKTEDRHRLLQSPWAWCRGCTWFSALATTKHVPKRRRCSTQGYGDSHRLADGTFTIPQAEQISLKLCRRLEGKLLDVGSASVFGQWYRLFSYFMVKQDIKHSVLFKLPVSGYS